MIAKSERFELRLDQSLIQRIDIWRSEKGDVSRSEAVRQLVEIGLDMKATEDVALTPGEKLLTVMLSDIYKHLGIARRASEIDAEFVSKVIFGGHLWALRWELSGLFHGHLDKPQVVTDVVDVLDMWSFLEDSFQKLDEAERVLLKEEAAPFGGRVEFNGFDGNNESEHRSVALFLVREMNRFSVFAGRELNSHMPKMETYRRMLNVFLPIRKNLTGRLLSREEIASILVAREHSGAQ